MEFFCAASLCREGVNIEEELCKFKDEDRLHAVVTYMAGLFSLNPVIPYSSDYKGVTEKFLSLLGNDQSLWQRDTSIQKVFRGIMQKPSDPGQQQVETIHTEADIQVTEREIEMSMRRIHLLLEALRASGEKMRPQPIIRKVFVPNDRDAVGVNTYKSVDGIPRLQCWPHLYKRLVLCNKGQNQRREQRQTSTRKHVFFCVPLQCYKTSQGKKPYRGVVPPGYPPWTSKDEIFPKKVSGYLSTEKGVPPLWIKIWICHW